MQGPDDRADRYEDFSIPFPLWPLNALKIHAVQFGISLGVLLGLLGRSDSRLSIDLWVSAGTLEARTVAILVALSIAMYAIGIREADPIEGVQGSYTVLEERETCPECSAEGLRRSVHTLAGVHGWRCPVCSWMGEHPEDN